MFDFPTELTMISIMVAVFATVLCIFVVRYYFYAKRKNLKDTWLLTNWQEAVYDVFFSTKDPAAVAKSVGINAFKYIQSCKLCRMRPRLKKIVIERVIGLLLLSVGLVLFLFTESLFVLVVSATVSFLLIFYPVSFSKNKLEKRKFKIAEELPRFMDLLHTALNIDVPTTQALQITAEHLPDMILSQEIKRALADTQMGVVSWQSALEGLANDYQIEVLAEFSMELINAYNNGVPVADAVKRKSRDIKQTNIFNLKERAKKMTSTILFPVMVFKIIPIIIILCVPVIQQLNGSGFGL